jgi:TonB family protein
MSMVRRLVGSSASAAGTLVQLAVIAATLPQWRECPANALCLHEAGPIEVVDLDWRPFVDAVVGSDGGGWPPDGPFCPGQVSAHAAAVDAAPLPAGYDPHAYPDRGLFACVRIDESGAVTGVRLLAGTGRAALDQALVAAIAREWRFSSERGKAAGWHRVRLNSGGRFIPPPLDPI